MSSNKNNRGQVTWSKYSRNEINLLWRTKKCLLDHTNEENDVEALDHLRYHDLPGREWTAKAQCELFLRDKDANVVTLHDICQILQCETPVKDRYFFAGPALDGTHCALGKESRGGKCVPVIEPPYIFKYCEKDKWSEWKEDDCRSRCLKKSKGVIIKRRSCRHQSHRAANCGGLYYTVDLCDDLNICNSRQTIADFTTIECSKFSLAMKTYDGEYLYIPENKSGMQINHDIKTPWIACTIFCHYETNDSFYYYSPYLELLDLAIDPYFPDGTWCHYQDGQNYYCRHQYCLPENYSVENNY